MTVTPVADERYMSTNLYEVLMQQGRRQDWLAKQVGFSRSFISKVALRQRPIKRADAERVAALLGVPFFVLFELHKGDDGVTGETE